MTSRNHIVDYLERLPRMSLSDREAIVMKAARRAGRYGLQRDLLMEPLLPAFDSLTARGELSIKGVAL